jgi:hypothetical protein
MKVHQSSEQESGSPFILSDGIPFVLGTFTSKAKIVRNGTLKSDKKYFTYIQRFSSR